MAKNKICGYKHCRCETKEIPLGEEIKVSSRYYHEKCAKESEDIKEMKKQYFDNISNTVVQAILGKVVNDIVYGKNIDSGYLLFAIKYAISNKIRINSPYGLHYLIDNKRIKDSWSALQSKEIQKSISVDISFDKTDEVIFTAKTPKKTGGFGDILKGV